MKFRRLASCLLLSIIVFSPGGSLLAQLNPAFFAPAAPYDSGKQFPQFLTVADVNGDGKLDVIVANQYSESLYANVGIYANVGVLLGYGDGAFQPAVTYDSGGLGARFVAVADVNSDGKLDLAIANAGCGDVNICGYNGSVHELLGNGDGTFQPGLTYYVDGLVSSVAASDVNGDRKTDLLVTTQCVPAGDCLPDYDPGQVTVLLGSGDGSFEAAGKYWTGGFGAWSITVTDVDKDGRPDMIVANYDGEVGVLRGNGDGTFKPALTYFTSGVYMPSVAVGDVNGDGKPDLVVINGETEINQSNPFDSSVGVLLGNGDGTFQQVVLWSAGGVLSGVSVAVADVNGDGKLDILVANSHDFSLPFPSNGYVAVQLGNGDGTFEVPWCHISCVPPTYDSAGLVAQWVAASDVNGDGKPDLLVANFTSSTVGVLINETPWQYQAAVQQPINADGSSIFSAKRGIVPVKFAMTDGTQPTCTLPATIAVTRIAGGTLGSIEEATFLSNANRGSKFRIDQTACQYIYNLAASSLGAGTYRVEIRVNGITTAGHAVFALK